MRKKFAIVIVLVIIPLSLAANPVEKFRANIDFYQNGTAEIKNIEIIETERTSSTFYRTENNFSMELITTDQSIKKKNLPVSFSFPISRTERVYKNQTGLSLIFNYNKSIEKMKILHNNRKVTEASFLDRLCSNSDNTCSSYCDGKGVDVDCTCGDGVCQESSNERELCPQDCRNRSPNGNEEDSQDNQSFTEKNREPEKNTDVVDSGYNTGILLVIGILAILLSLILASSKVKIEA